MPPVLVGWDPGLTTGCAVLCAETGRVLATAQCKHDKVLSLTRTIWKRYDVQYYVIEAVAHNSDFTPKHIRDIMQNIHRELYAISNVGKKLVTPSVWKQNPRYKVTKYKSQHINDAVGIGMWGYDWHRQNYPTARHE